MLEADVALESTSGGVDSSKTTAVGLKSGGFLRLSEQRSL